MKVSGMRNNSLDLPVSASNAVNTAACAVLPPSATQRFPDGPSAFEVAGGLCWVYELGGAAGNKCSVFLAN